MLVLGDLHPAKFGNALRPVRDPALFGGRLSGPDGLARLAAAMFQDHPGQDCQAVFQKAGKTHVFVKVGERFEQREVKIVHQSESRAAVEGLGEGTEIALIDPTVPRSTTPGAAASPVIGSGAAK